MLQLPPANNVVSSSEIFPLPDTFRAFANRICEGFGISLDAATLMIIQAIGFSAGDSVCIQTPEGRVVGASFNVALIASSSRSLPRGALMSLLAPVRSVVAEAAQSCTSRGLQATRNWLEYFLSQRRELEQSVAAEEKEFRKQEIKAKNAFHAMDTLEAAGRTD